MRGGAGLIDNGFRVVGLVKLKLSAPARIHFLAGAGLWPSTWNWLDVAKVQGGALAEELPRLGIVIRKGRGVSAQKPWTQECCRLP